MMIRSQKLGLLYIAAVLSFCSAATATTLQRMSVAKMSNAAHAIVRARCVANSTRWDAGEIWTFTTFDVEETWKSSTRGRITVRLLGGEVGNLKSTVSGVPRFAPGEELVLFLERTAAGDFSVLSWVQGTFRIGHDRAMNEEIVTQDTAAFAILNPASHRFEASGIRKMRTDAFHALVASALENSGGGKQ
jgi:hypothetical protein